MCIRKKKKEYLCLFIKAIISNNMNDTDKTSDKMQNETKKKHNWTAKTYEAPGKKQQVMIRTNIKQSSKRILAICRTKNKTNKNKNNKKSEYSIIF